MGGLVDCALAAWSPGIGDPTVTGWLTVLLYALAAAASLRAARSGGFAPQTRGRERAFWILMAAGMALLALNKQLDLQTFLTDIGRCSAHRSGWYEDRRRVQIVFVLSLVIWGGLAGLGLLWALRRTLRRTGLALAGAVFVAVFVLVRAVGFHGIDRMIGMTVATGIPVNALLEMPGPILVIVGAMSQRGAPRGLAEP